MSNFSVLLSFEINNSNVYTSVGSFPTFYSGSEVRKLATDSLKATTFASHCIARITYINRTFNMSIDLHDETKFESNESFVIQIEVSVALLLNALIVLYLIYLFLF